MKKSASDLQHPYKNITSAIVNSIVDPRISLGLNKENQGSTHHASHVVLKKSTGVFNSPHADGNFTPVKKDIGFSSPIGYRRIVSSDIKQNLSASPILPPLNASQQIATPLRDYRFLTAPQKTAHSSMIKSTTQLKESEDVFKSFSKRSIGLSTSNIFHHFLIS